MRRLALPIAGLVVTAVAVSPAAALLVRVLQEPGIAWEVLASPREWEFLGRSVLLATMVAVTSMFFGALSAWCIVRIALPRIMQVALMVLLCLPLAIPSYVATFGIIVATGPNGLLGGWLPTGFHLRDHPTFSAWAVLSSCTMPYVFLIVRSAMLRECGSLEEAALGLGSGRLRAFLRITLPRITPAALWGGLLAALYTLADFGAVSMLGYQSLTWAIYARYNMAYGIEEARVLAVMLGVAGLCIILLMRSFRARNLGTVAATHQPHTRHTPGPLTLGAMVLILLPVAVAVVLPVATSVQWAFPDGGASAGSWVNVLQPAWNTVMLAMISALVVILLALPIAGLEISRHRRTAQLLAGITLLGFALPGLVVAVGMVSLALSLDEALDLVFQGARRNYIYQTLLVLIGAYAALFLPEGVGPLRNAAAQIHHEQIDAARQLEPSVWRRWRRIVLPQLVPGAVAGAALVFVTTARELPATLILRPANFETLATRIWSDMEDVVFEQAAVNSLALIAVCAAGLAVVFSAERHVR